MNNATNGDAERPVRFGLVGCGHISRHHIAAMQEVEGAQLTSVCDINPDTLQMAVEKTGAAGFSKLSDMLDEARPDVVVLAAPSGLRTRQVREVAATGCHVMVEKPMATRWEDGLEMIRACDEAGVRLFVVQQFRYTPSLQLLRQALNEGRLGRVYMATINMFWTRPQAYYDTGGWRGTWEFDGGALMNQASHFADLLHWLFGPVDSVHAYGATLARDIEAEDTMALSVRWRHGGLGTLNISVLTYPKNYETSLTVIAEKGTVRLNGMAMNEIQHWELAEAREEDVQLVREASWEVARLAGYGHRRYYANVVRVLRDGASPDTDGRDALKTLELMVAAYRSARDGVRVGLPLQL